MKLPAKVTVVMSVFPAWKWIICDVETGKAVKRFKDTESMLRFWDKHYATAV